MAQQWTMVMGRDCISEWTRTFDSPKQAVQFCEEATVNDSFGFRGLCKDGKEVISRSEIWHVACARHDAHHSNDPDFRRSGMRKWNAFCMKWAGQ